MHVKGGHPALSLFAVEHIRRMRGGTQSHLMRCSDGFYYVVKFQNNPQGVRTLANDLLGTRLAKRFGLPVAESVVINVNEDLIRLTAEMTTNLQRTSVPCRPGPSFGSRYLCVELIGGSPIPESVFNFLPPNHLRRVSNLSDFLGMLVFDKWTHNLDQRQTIFLHDRDEASWRAVMIDQGLCFDGIEWSFHDSYSDGLYYPSTVYESVEGLDAFELWLDRLEYDFDATVLGELASEIPPEWYQRDTEALRRLLETLNRRRSAVRNLLWETWKNSPRTFPNWVERRRAARA
jgi:hypothetical protein